MLLNRCTLERWLGTFQLPGDLENDVYCVPCSGGADSSALAIVLKRMFPTVAFKYMFTDTGAEHPAIYEALDRLEDYLGQPIERVDGGETLWSLIDSYNGFLPSSQQRWCTRMLKLRPFQQWLKQFDGRHKHMFIGVRADESQRIAFTLDDADTHMPFIDLGVMREDVFKLLEETVGIPSLYEYRTRSGCSTCPFQRRSELVGLLQSSPLEFERGMNYERLGVSDGLRQEPAMPLWKDSGLAMNWLWLPKPKRGQELSGSVGSKKANLFGDVGIFVGAEFFEDGFPGMGSFTYHQRIVSYSPTLAGIKKQLQDRYEHLLSTSEVYQLSPQDVREQSRFAIYYIEAPATVLDVDGPSEGSYTWHQGSSYRQVQHIVSWAKRVLNAADMGNQAALLDKVPATSWWYEHAQDCATGLSKIRDEIGALVASGWFTPKEPVDDGEYDELATPCPMCNV